MLEMGKADKQTVLSACKRAGAVRPNKLFLIRVVGGVLFCQSFKQWSSLHKAKEDIVKHCFLDRQKAIGRAEEETSDLAKEKQC